MDLQWKRDMRQGVVTCLCEVGLGSGAFPWIGGAQQEKSCHHRYDNNLSNIVVINVAINILPTIAFL